MLLRQQLFQCKSLFHWCPSGAHNFVKITTSERPSSIMAWWRHQMETFSALLALFAGNSQVTGEFPSQRPVTRSFDVFFDLRLNKRLSKQSWGRWLDAPLRPLWRHCNGFWLTDACATRKSKPMKIVINRYQWCYQESSVVIQTHGPLFTNSIGIRL